MRSLDTRIKERAESGSMAAIFIGIFLIIGFGSLLIGIYIWAHGRHACRQSYDQMPEAKTKPNMLRRMPKRLLGNQVLQGDRPLLEVSGDRGVELPGLGVSRELPAGDVAAELLAGRNERATRQAEEDRLKGRPRVLKSEYD